MVAVTWISQTDHAQAGVASSCNTSIPIDDQLPKRPTMLVPHAFSASIDRMRSRSLCITRSTSVLTRLGPAAVCRTQCVCLCLALGSILRVPESYTDCLQFSTHFCELRFMPACRPTPIVVIGRAECCTGMCRVLGTVLELTQVLRRETASSRRASFAVYPAPALHASLLPPHSPPPDRVENSFARAGQLAVRCASPSQFAQQAFPTAAA